MSHLVNKNGKSVKIDTPSHGLLAVDEGVHCVHEGKRFGAYWTGSLTSGQVGAIGLTTPSSEKRVHLSWAILCGAACTFDLREGTAARVDGGTTYNNTLMNYNRDVTTVCESVVVTGDTAGSDLPTLAGRDLVPGIFSVFIY